MKLFLSFNTIFSGVKLLLQDEKNIIEVENIESSKQSEVLVSSINNILSRHNLKYNDIDVFSTVTGPGNFTGIKTSLAVLKAISISTNKKIITNNAFEIVSYETNFYDYIILNIGTVKYYIKSKTGEYFVIFKKDIAEFLSNNKKIITNDSELIGKNIIFSDLTDEKWANLIYYKFKNGIFTENIEPLYIEKALVTKRKN